MSPASEITINDFLSRLYILRDESFARAAREAKQLTAANAARGLLKSGTTLKSLASIVETEFDNTLAAMLHVLVQAKPVPTIDYSALREQTFLCAKALIATLADACGMEKWYKVIGSAAAEKIIRERLDLLPRLQYRMRQFDVGLDDAVTADRGNVTNNVVNAHTISGVVQQGGENATLSARVSYDLTNIAGAARELGTQLANEPNRDQPAVRQLAAEVAVIQAQLSAPEPRTSVIREAGQTIRTIAEQAVAGALSPGAIAAAAALGALFG